MSEIARIIERCGWRDARQRRLLGDIRQVLSGTYTQADLDLLLARISEELSRDNGAASTKVDA